MTTSESQILDKYTNKLLALLAKEAIDSDDANHFNLKIVRKNCRKAVEDTFKSIADIWKSVTYYVEDEDSGEDSEEDSEEDGEKENDSEEEDEENDSEEEDEENDSENDSEEEDEENDSEEEDEENDSEEEDEENEKHVNDILEKNAKSLTKILSVRNKFSIDQGRVLTLLKKAKEEYYTLWD